MRILINCSNMKAGGGLQVADSLCRNLYRYPQHHFVVVLSQQLSYIEEELSQVENIETIIYTTTNKISSLLTGRDKTLDGIVVSRNVDIVFFVFGPSLWIPKIPTVCGFAMPHIVLQDSPFWNTFPKMSLAKIRFRNWLQKISFNKLSDCYFTENPYITKRLALIFPKKRISTISNTSHQIFDNVEAWDKSITLPDFNGFTLLTISSNSPHKNLRIIPQVLRELKKQQPQLNVRFVLTVSESDYGPIDDEFKDNVLTLGKVNIKQCPWLYQQSDALFLPTLLECFSANYVEAMKMRRPILTSDLGFAHSLCEDSALYFNAIDPADIADKIALLISDNSLRENLVAKGETQLQNFESDSSRADKIISLIESEGARLNIK